MSKPKNASVNTSVTPSTSTKSKSAKARSLEAVTATLTTKDRLMFWQHSVVHKHWRIALSGALTAIAAGAVGLNIPLVNLFDRQMQSLFFELRGPVAAPAEIVILAIDEDSINQGRYYSDDPERYTSLQTMRSWPWQRRAYAQAIERLMAAGAKTVAVDLLLSLESPYGDGKSDDAALTKVIERYGDRVVLAGAYKEDLRLQGNYWVSTLPLPQFEDAGAHIGLINLAIEPNNQFHRLGQAFIRDNLIGETAPFSPSATALEASEEDLNANQPLLSFAQATLKAAGQPLNDKPQENIFFYGPANTFQHVSFWKVIDDDPWQKELDGGRFFAGKTVLIGATAAQGQDFHPAPFSESLLYPQRMAGVEVQANAIATLQNGLSPKQLIKKPEANALIVIALGLSVALLMSRTQRPLNRLLIMAGGLVFWTMSSYSAFVWGTTVIITGIPVAMLTSMGLVDFGAGFAADRLKRRRLRRTLARYATSPLVQEIISQQDEFQDLLDVNRVDLIGMILRDRYKILKVLGAGGFGETYLAQDTLRPGSPVCVVKQLKIVSDNPKAHRLARRLFESEAIVLGQLGEHNQIPRLLAYFEVQDSFYLVQEMIEGKLLRDILAKSRPLSQRAVVRLLLDLLPVINFVHSKGVIHRDIKPSNIIRREEDKR
ncbi:MAG: CHASE2 domain-containing protein, partial [Cyanobacteria bacterium P01_D01_bin.105]